MRERERERVNKIEGMFLFGEQGVFWEERGNVVFMRVSFEMFESVQSFVKVRKFNCISPFFCCSVQIFLFLLICVFVVTVQILMQL